MDSKILALLSSKVEDKLTALRDFISSGSCKDFAEYQNCAGQVRGLLSARYEIDALVQKIKESDDE